MPQTDNLRLDLVTLEKNCDLTVSLRVLFEWQDTLTEVKIIYYPHRLFPHVTDVSRTAPNDLLIT